MKINDISLSGNFLSSELTKLLMPFLPHYFMMEKSGWFDSVNTFAIGDLNTPNSNCYQGGLI